MATIGSMSCIACLSYARSPGGTEFQPIKGFGTQSAQNVRCQNSVLLYCLDRCLQVYARDSNEQPDLLLNYLIDFSAE